MSLVLVHGVFNVLHEGHVRVLKYAKTQGSRLVVAVWNDALANQSPLVSEDERREAVLSLGLADDVIVTNLSPAQLVLTLRPSIIVKGKEYEYAFNPESEPLKEIGGKLVFHAGAEPDGFGSQLKPLDLDLSKDEALQGFLGRHQISERQLQRIIKLYKDQRVLVVGDLILDEYHRCEPIGISQEDKTMVVRTTDVKKFVGGAGIVAKHASTLGAQTTYITIVGNDSESAFARQNLQQSGVTPIFLTDDSRPTIKKLRYRSTDSVLFRVSEISNQPVQAYFHDVIFDEVKARIDDTSLLVLSDFNYGALSDSLIDRLTELANEHGVICVADSQCSSQKGDISRFKKCHLLTPTEFEIRSSLNDDESGLVVLASNLVRMTGSKAAVIKLGEKGVLLHNAQRDGAGYTTDQIPALNQNAVDSSGAGDSMLIAAAMAIKAGATLAEAILIGSIASAIQVSRLGNVPITIDELASNINL